MFSLGFFTPDFGMHETTFGGHRNGRTYRGPVAATNGPPTMPLKLSAGIPLNGPYSVAIWPRLIGGPRLISLLSPKFQCADLRNLDGFGGGGVFATKARSCFFRKCLRTEIRSADVRNIFRHCSSEKISSQIIISDQKV
jgi:hypothetical protein